MNRIRVTARLEKNVFILSPTMMNTWAAAPAWEKIIKGKIERRSMLRLATIEIVQPPLKIRVRNVRIFDLESQGHFWGNR